MSHKHSARPIRFGCYVEWVHEKKHYSGFVVDHHYTEKGIHKIRIESFINTHYKIMRHIDAKEIYTNLRHHVPGAASVETRRARKKEQRRRKRIERLKKRVKKPAKKKDARKP